MYWISTVLASYAQWLVRNQWSLNKHVEKLVRENVQQIHCEQKRDLSILALSSLLDAKALSERGIFIFI